MRQREKGFTLVEVIIAVAILAVVTIPVMKLFIQTANIDSVARQTQKATDIAQNVLEGIREYSMEEIIEQCMDVGKGGKLDFLTDWCDNYTPSNTYMNIENLTDDKQIFVDDGSTLSFIQQLAASKNIDGSYGIWGNAQKVEETDNNTSEKEISIDFKGDMIRFAIRGVQYPAGSSTYDIIVSFDVSGKSINNKYRLDGEHYYLYNVTVSVYQTVGGASAKRASVTGAVQNKPSSDIIIKEEKDEAEEIALYLQHGHVSGGSMLHKYPNENCSIMKTFVPGSSGGIQSATGTFESLKGQKGIIICPQCFPNN